MIAGVRQRSLPDAISAGLAGFPAAPAGRALAALQTLTEGLPLHTGAGGIWASSGLTGDGFPLELAFTTADPALRWTFDPAVPGLAPAARLDSAMAGLKRLGWSIEPELAACAVGLQEGRAEGFGGWIGGRHDDHGNRFKLYVDMPEGPGAEAALDLLDLPRPRLPGAPARTRMLGLGPDKGRVEVYFRAEAPVQSLPRLLEPIGGAEAARRAHELIEQAWGHRLRDRLPGGSVGVSYATSGRGTRPLVTLFLFARALWGGDGRIRARMVERLAAARTPIGPYEEATRPLTGARSARTRHGMIGITLSPGDIHWSVGLRPVATPC